LIKKIQNAFIAYTYKLVLVVAYRKKQIDSLKKKKTN